MEGIFAQVQVVIHTAQRIFVLRRAPLHEMLSLYYLSTKFHSRESGSFFENGIMTGLACKHKI
jgi:hypothetical protein